MEGMVHERYGTWKVWYMEGMVHGRYGTLKVRYMKGMVHGRYGTWKVRYMKGMVHERFGTWKVWYMKGTVHGRYVYHNDRHITRSQARYYTTINRSVATHRPQPGIGIEPCQKRLL